MTNHLIQIYIDSNVVSPGFEPRQSVPKTEVLPLHNETRFAELLLSATNFWRKLNLNAMVSAAAAAAAAAGLILAFDFSLVVFGLIFRVTIISEYHLEEL